jgi:DNA-binding HxlR family transcriptional regulator
MLNNYGNILNNYSEDNERFNNLCSNIIVTNKVISNMLEELEIPFENIKNDKN